VNNSNANISMKLARGSGPPSISQSKKGIVTRPSPITSVKNLAEDKVAKLKYKYQTIGDNIAEET
jgi:hypothetical protein